VKREVPTAKPSMITQRNEGRVARIFQDVSEADDAEHSQQAEDYQQAAGHGGHQHGNDPRQRGQGTDEGARIGEASWVHM